MTSTLATLTPEVELQQLEGLVGQIVGILQSALSSGETIPDELQGLLARNLEAGNERIQTLRQQIMPQVEPSIPPEVPLLWQLSGKKEDIFTEYLRNYPSPQTENLLRNPGELERIIEHLHAMDPSTQPMQVGDIQQAPMQSSNVWGTAYDVKSGKMKVRFQGGSVYEYDGVPLNVYKAVVSGGAQARTDGQNQYGKWWRGKSPSIGAALSQYVKDAGFPYQKIQ